MILLELRITNFRSFKRTQRFVFPQGPGLFFMQGVNEVEPRLDANGAGKSTIWEALTWLLFGKTSRGLKAGDVGNWDAGKGTVVELDFVAPSGEDCTLQRTWKPNAWRLFSTGQPQDYDDLDKAPRNAFYDWLGVSQMEPWLHCVLMAQNQPMFLDLKAEAKAQLFAQVMDLERWSEFGSRASKAASTEDRGLRVAEQQLAQVKGELEATARVDYKKDRETWERERAEKIDRLEIEAANYEEHSTVREDLEWAEGEEAKARERLKAAVQVMDGAELMVREIDKTVREISAKHAKAQGLYDAAKKIFDESQQGTCPTCGQPTGADDRHVDQLRRKLRELDLQLTDHHDHLKRLHKEQKRFGAALEEAERQVKAARNDVYDAEDKVKGYRRDKLIEDKRLKAIDEEIEDLRAKTNPFDRMEADTEKRLRGLRAERDDLERDIERKQWQWSLLNYWTKGFKEVRLQEIAGALTELEIEVNSAVAALGLSEWSLEFQVDRETKSGSISRGFNAFVQSPHNARAVPWEAWSGGEAQRLRLASTMGLSDLIRSRTALAMALEVWDEPTQGLSPSGVQDLLEALAHRARHEQRQIWVVDHRSYDFGGFSGGAKIVKTPSGSLIRSV